MSNRIPIQSNILDSELYLALIANSYGNPVCPLDVVCSNMFCNKYHAKLPVAYSRIVDKEENERKRNEACDAARKDRPSICRYRHSSMDSFQESRTERYSFFVATPILKIKIRLDRIHDSD